MVEIAINLFTTRCPHGLRVFSSGPRELFFGGREEGLSGVPGKLGNPGFPGSLENIGFPKTPGFPGNLGLPRFRRISRKFRISLEI